MAGVLEKLFEEEEEEKMDYMEQVGGWVSAGAAFVMDAPLILLNMVLAAALIAYEVIVSYGEMAIDAVGLREWWEVEHTVMLLTIVLILPSAYKRNKGDCRKTAQQMLSMVYSVAWTGVFLRFAIGIQGGTVFGGKLAHPTAFLFSILITGIALSFSGVMKEIHGYGADDGPPDANTQKVMVMYDAMAGLESAMALSIAAFGLPDVLNCDGEDMRPWLIVFPMIGFFNGLNKWAAHDTEVAKVVDANGTPAPAPVEEDAQPVAEEEEAAKPADEPEAIEEPAKEVELAEDKKTEVEEKKVEDEPVAEADAKAKACCMCSSFFSNPVSKVTGLLTCIVSKVTGLLTCIVSKVHCMVMSIVDKVMALPWECILTSVSDLGTNALVFTVFWALTDADMACLAFPLINVVLPVVLSKVQERGHLTKHTSHIITEAGKGINMCILYMFCRSYVAPA